MNFYQRLLLVLAAAIFLFGVVLIFSFEIIKVEWITFMEIQPSYKPMENPLPVANRSIPIEGPAYIAGQGAPANPVEADETSIERGRVLYSINCSQCHGPNADGNGVLAGALVFQPANLGGDVVQSKPDGSLFLTVSNGIQGANGQIHMPALNENLTVRDRWDVVNYLRTVKATPTPAATPETGATATPVPAPTATP